MGTEQTKTLVVKRLNTAFEVTIPKDYKVTFGAHRPGSKSVTIYKAGEPLPNNDDSLRIYRATNNQVACFRHVVSFYEKDLVIEKIAMEEDD